MCEPEKETEGGKAEYGGRGLLAYIASPWSKPGLLPQCAFRAWDIGVLLGVGWRDWATCEPAMPLISI